MKKQASTKKTTKKEQTDQVKDTCQDKIAELQETIRLQEEKLQEANDKFLRLFSEFDNFRKRTHKERLELSKTASADIISAMLPVLDDLERASKMLGNETGETAETAGLVLIYNKLKSILRQKGVEEIDAVGQVFDTDYHDAITHIPAESPEMKGRVVDEVTKGYILNGKIIRHSRVVVAN